MVQIKAQFRKYIFRADNGYTVALVKVREVEAEELIDYKNKTITIVGYFNELNDDDFYIFSGKGVETDKYGFQFQVESFDRVKPDSIDGIIEFLSSDLFVGIGEKTARKIVEELKDNILEKILESSDNLKAVNGLTTKKAIMIHETLVKYETSHATIVKLCDLGFTMKDSLNVYNKYKENTLLKIEENIYDLIDDIYEINFKKVDKIALTKGYDFNDEKRIKAIIIYLLKTLCFKNGDVYLLLEGFIKAVLSFLEYNISEESLTNILEILNKEEKIILEKEKIYLKEYHQNEYFIAERLTEINSLKKYKVKDIDKKIKDLEKHFNILYNDEQKNAIKLAIENNFSIITGGPGTGKTTIIKAIVELYKGMNRLSYEDLTNDLKLLAPTGRAAKRMSESTLLPASTIHRFLKWDKEADIFEINEFNRDFSKFIIIDEVSMIDNNLFASLLKGLTKNIKIVMVGDFNQLPSVGEGQVLKDMIESEVLNVVDLKNLYRQDEDSFIVDLAYLIKDGELTEEVLTKKSDYNFINTKSCDIKKNIKDITLKSMERGYNFKSIQVLAPIYKGENGIDRLNIMLQDIFNPYDKLKNEFKYGDIILRENDKVLQLVNLPDENVFNGDVGVIVSITKDETNKLTILIDFDGVFVKYGIKDLIYIKHAYAISIHKSQGSEYEMVIMPITMQYHMMLYRKLLYTGVTRAKKKLIIVGDPRAFNNGVVNNVEIPRKTTLKELLIKLSS